MGTLLSHPAALANIMRRIAVDAGEMILDYFDEGAAFSHDIKADGSPVTDADRKSEEFIAKALTDAVPGVAVVGEECVSAGSYRFEKSEYFWLVDPLDGTREFVTGSPDFTVNIALIREGRPVLGVIHAPALGETIWTDGEGNALRWTEEGKKEKRIQCRKPPRSGLTVVASRNRGIADIDRYLEEFKVEKLVRRGSSIKICMVAAGKADLYPGLSETCEWDTAAGQAILEAAGGEIVTTGGEALIYGKGDSFANPQFVARSKYLSDAINDEKNV